VKNKRIGVGGGRRFLLPLQFCGRRKICVFDIGKKKKKKVVVGKQGKPGSTPR
jgi:hypothetical protein